MLLTCPTCALSYAVSRADLGDARRVVICSDCETQWFAGGIEIPPAASNDDRRAANPKPSKTPRQLAAGPSFLERRIMPWMGRLAAASTIAAVLAISVTQRDRIARHVPRVVAVYRALGLDVNPVGLAFDALAPRRLASSDVTVAGGIRNIAHNRVTVPRIAFEVRDAAGAPLLSWNEAAPARTLAAGATMSFVSAPHHMPSDSAFVAVRFASDESQGTERTGTLASSR